METIAEGSLHVTSKGFIGALVLIGLCVLALVLGGKDNDN